MIFKYLAAQWLGESRDSEEARRWAEQELSTPEYLAAQPNAFDRAALAVWEFIENLLSPNLENGSGGVMLTLIVGVLILATLVIGILLWGRPRSSRRVRTAQMMLGERDHLSADELRRAAEKSAQAGDWGAALTQRYRALARGLIERELVDPAPGATAQAIAVTAAQAFPTMQEELREAATLFDGVRYLGAAGDYQGYLVIRTTDDRITTSPSPVQVPA